MFSSVTAVLVKRGDVGQRVPMLIYGRDALIRDLRAGQPDVGQQVTILNQGRGALIRERSVDQKGAMDSECQF